MNLRQQLRQQYVGELVVYRWFGLTAIHCLGFLYYWGVRLKVCTEKVTGKMQREFTQRYIKQSS